MADDISIKDATDAPRTVATDEVAGRNYQIVKTAFGSDNSATQVDAANPLPVTLSATGPAVTAINLTNASIGGVADAAASADTGSFSLNALFKRALANWTTLLGRIPALVSGRIPVDGSGVTQPVSGTVAVSGLVSVDTGLTQPLTDAQLRAAAVPISGTVNTGLSQPLTDAQLRNTAVPVSGTFWQATQPVSGTFWQATQPVSGTFWQATQPVSGPLTDAQLRATAINILEPATTYTGAAAQTATVNNIIESVSGANGTACANFRAGAIQVVSTGTAGTFIFEQSNDNVNWVALPVFNAALVTGVPITAAITASASAIIYTFPIRGQFVRLRIATTITGGSIQAFTRLSTEPWTPSAALVASNTAANMQVTADTEFAAAAALADGAANPTTASGGALTSEFNGTTWDRMRGNTSVSVEASSAKTATGNSASALTNHSASGAVLFINVSAASGTTPTLVVRAQMQDPVGAGWIDIPGAATASITGISNVALAIYPGATVAANAAVSYPLPRVWRLAWTITGTTPSFTFSVGAQYVK